jgi:hypothetical protein
MKMLFAAVAVATLIATPAFAQSYNPGRFDRPTVGANGQIQISAARAAALRECTARANQYPEYDWGTLPLHLYRACMTKHHQVE